MAWDLKTHLQDHATVFKQLDKIEVEDLHFNASWEDLQFGNFSKKEISKILQEITEEIEKQAEYSVMDGNRISKAKGQENNIIGKKYCIRTVKLKDYIVIIAIHLQGSLGEHTHPHIHIIIKKTAQLGKEFNLLKLHITKASRKIGQKYGLALIPNFAVHRVTLNKNLQTSLEKFFWQLKKINNQEFKKYILNNKQYTIKMLNKLIEQTKQTNNLSYYFKTLTTFQKRLKALKQDFYIVEKDKTLNLRYIIPSKFILKNKENIQVIELINNQKFNQKDLAKYVENPILKDYYRWNKDPKTAYIFTTLKEQTTLFNNVKKNKSFEENFIKVYKKHLSQLLKKPLKTELIEKENKKDFVKTAFKSIFKKALLTATTDKELREKVKELGNTEDFKKLTGGIKIEKFSYKKRKGKTIGFTFNNTYVNLKELGFENMEQINAIMLNNKYPNTIDNDYKIKFEYKEEKNARGKIQYANKKTAYRIIARVREQQQDIAKTIGRVAREQQRVGGTREQRNTKAEFGFGEIKNTITRGVRSRIFKKMGEFSKKFRGGISEFTNKWLEELRDRIRRGIKRGIQELTVQINKKFVLKKQEEDYIYKNTYPKRKL